VSHNAFATQITPSDSPGVNCMVVNYFAHEYHRLEVWSTAETRENGRIAARAHSVPAAARAAPHRFGARPRNLH
jgi:hypothetical protein